MHFMQEKILKPIAQRYVIPVLKGRSTFLTGASANRHFHIVSF